MSISANNFYINVKKNCLSFQLQQIDKVKTIFTECFEQVT